MDETGEIKIYLKREDRIKERFSKPNNALLNQYHTFNDPALLLPKMVESELPVNCQLSTAYWRLL